MNISFLIKKYQVFCNGICRNNNATTNGSFVNNTEDSEVCTKIDCSVNCVGKLGNWSHYNATCNDTFNSPTGIRTKTYTISTPSANGGIAYPPSETKICSCMIDYIYATRDNSYFFRTDKTVFVVEKTLGNYQ